MGRRGDAGVGSHPIAFRDKCPVVGDIVYLSRVKKKRTEQGGERDASKWILKTRKYEQMGRDTSELSLVSQSVLDLLCPAQADLHEVHTRD